MTMSVFLFPFFGLCFHWFPILLCSVIFPFSVFFVFFFSFRFCGRVFLSRIQTHVVRGSLWPVILDQLHRLLRQFGPGLHRGGPAEDFRTLRSNSGDPSLQRQGIRLYQVSVATPILFSLFFSNLKYFLKIIILASDSRRKSQPHKPSSRSTIQTSTVKMSNVPGARSLENLVALTMLRYLF